MIDLDAVTVAELEVVDPPRHDALDIVPRLHRLGVVHVAMLTGDHADVAEVIGDQLGIDVVYAEQTPEQKLEVVEAVRATPGLTPVVMVGDGINDAPALALADVGIAMGTGTDVAMHSAQITLVKGDLHGIAVAREISACTARRARGLGRWRRTCSRRSGGRRARALSRGV